MSKVLYGLALFCLVIGFHDVSTTPRGSRGATEGAILLILSPLFALGGYAASRASTKLCPACGERIKKAAAKCRFCGTDLTQT